MKVFNQIENVKHHPPVYMALGTFDGIHIGHQAIIMRTLQQAKNNNCSSAVFTFSNHPLDVIDADRCPPLIITNQEKVNLIAELGVDMLFNVPFTTEFLQLTPEKFIEKIVTNINLRHIIVGANFTYGYRGAGTPALLTAAGAKHGFTVDVVNMVDREGVIVSSTVIRQLVTEGAVKQAANLLGRLITMSGKISKGDQRGRKLGFPTANLAIVQGLLVPSDGVYAVYVYDEAGAKYNGVANVGNNPTFTRQTHRIEVHILNFDRVIYGQQLKIQFIDRIRGEIAFTNVRQLKEQMQSDIEFARKHYF
ncbi:Riboflavin biosynthesis protein RibF [Sporomusa ovata DSM 2662]|uniref:Riboflavin biosynthesis protein n=1 Tax=Sporomusa ovata TaxID=2378 RepID=A0A0U1KVS3_9FIRM|nr:bifunctional riboflavin kinase/FAD synthetase [Sporomusa ovata]EQB29488.1 riboflavin biosynthesis protein RibC [Sporomusa ovata DSM 2662]CQR71538.1 Riboflavin kinase / FMN adenylyltransferase [Sporomusa ovata]